MLSMAGNIVGLGSNNASLEVPLQSDIKSMVQLRCSDVAPGHKSRFRTYFVNLVEVRFAASRSAVLCCGRFRVRRRVRYINGSILSRKSASKLSRGC
jgi:hypothetical protein